MKNKRKRQNHAQVRARAAVNSAVRAGKMVPAKFLHCVRCENEAAEYHHWSYLPEHRLEVIPLCKQCHVETYREHAQ